MNELITINYDDEQPTVLGRDLHEALEVKTAYKDWFRRMCEYGFDENKDYTRCSNLSSENQHGGQNKIDHQLTIPMAKEICMLQRSEKGKMFRQYFISVEEQWNTPEAVMARALQFANRQIDLIKNQNRQLTQTVAVQTQQIAEMKPKVSYYDIVLNCKDLIPISVIAKDYGMSAKWLNNFLQEHKVQYKQGKKIWLLHQKYAEKGYTSTKTHIVNSTDGEIHPKVHTYWTQKGRLFIYDLLKLNGILPLIEREEVA